jgi:hypothetical protein
VNRPVGSTVTTATTDSADLRVGLLGLVLGLWYRLRRRPTYEVILPDGTRVECWLTEDRPEVEPDEAPAYRIDATYNGVSLPVEAIKTPGGGYVTVGAEPDTPAASSERFDQAHRRLGVDPATVPPLRRERHVEVCGKLRRTETRTMLRPGGLTPRSGSHAPISRPRASAGRRRRGSTAGSAGDPPPGQADDPHLGRRRALRPSREGGWW